MKKKNVAAFFDIDGTLYREGLITEVFKKMVNHEIIAKQKWIDDVRPAFMKWDRRQGEYDTYLSKMVEIFKDTTVGISKEHIEWIAKQVVEQKGERVYLFTRRELERHKRLGHLVIAISGSPLELVTEMAKKHSFDDYKGTEYKTNSKGIYTGKIVPMWDSVSKKKALHYFEKKYNLDIDQCYSYGDTNGDISMFSCTGHPCAVNPTRELLTNIQKDKKLKEKMRIVVERKDVIYNIDINNLNLEKKKQEATYDCFRNCCTPSTDRCT